MQSGIIFKIQKYSIHDGPGIRTAIFLKGCFLHCWWCHNPEGQGASICLNEKQFSNNVLVDLEYSVTVEQVMHIIQKDIIFYDESGGGATFTGGEPFQQPDFLYEMLKHCRKHYVHTAVETSGFTDWNNIEKVAQYTDLFLYDLKHMDDKKHQEYTGVSNEIILDNLAKLSRIHSDICIRIPIIPGINDDRDNLDRACRFLQSIQIKQIHLLPYHNMGTYKYKKLGRPNPLTNLGIPNSKQMNMIAEIFAQYEIMTNIGG